MMNPKAIGKKKLLEAVNCVVVHSPGLALVGRFLGWGTGGQDATSWAAVMEAAATPGAFSCMMSCWSWLERASWRSTCNHSHTGNTVVLRALGPACSNSYTGNMAVVRALGADCSHSHTGNMVVVRALGTACSHSHTGNMVVVGALGETCSQSHTGNMVVVRALGAACSHSHTGNMVFVRLMTACSQPAAMATRAVKMLGSPTDGKLALLMLLELACLLRNAPTVCCQQWVVVMGTVELDQIQAPE